MTSSHRPDDPGLSGEPSFANRLAALESDASPALSNGHAAARASDEAAFVENESSGLRDFLAVILRHRWSALCAFLLVAGIGTLYVFRQTPIYTSTPALLEIVSDNSGIATIRDVFERQFVSAQNFETQMNLIKSESVLRSAYAKAPALGCSHRSSQKIYDPSF